MKKILTFKEFENSNIDNALVPSMGPINYNCPNCGNNMFIDIIKYPPKTNPIPCDDCGIDFEYPWPSNSWRWV